ncbi:hypothetical protein, partial [Eubacterium aggregans]|uniref:hypothetical protein n=1 Tax=Eubacterium aggregans TaxID=81409 RepID=UPI003F2A1E10
MGSVNYADSGYLFIFDVIKEYYGNSWGIVLILVLSTIFLCCDNRDGDRYSFGYMTCALCLTVYNPFFIQVLMKILHFENEYYRFMWLLPTAAIIACAFIRLLKRVSLKCLKGSIVVIAAMLFVITGPISYARSNFTWQENIYKVSNELIETVNIIKMDSDNENHVVVYEQDFNFVVRQYDASIHLALERNRLLYALGSVTVGEYSDEDYNNQRIIIGATMLGED